MNNNKYAVYCVSTYPIFVGLYYKSLGYDVKFIYTNEQYAQFFEKLGVDAVKFQPPAVDSYYSNKTSVKKKLTELKKYVDNRSFLFTHEQYSAFLFAAISFLHKTNEIVCVPCEPRVSGSVSFTDLLKSKVLKSFIKAYLLKYSLKYFFNTSVKVKSFKKSAFVYIDDDFNKLYNIKTEALPESYEVIQNRTAAAFQIIENEIDFLFIGQNEATLIGRTFDRESFFNVFKLINELNIKYKPHPGGYPTNHINQSNILSMGVPTELILGCVSKAIISISSTSLISASHYYENSNVKIISVYKLLNHLDKAAYESMMKRFNERSNGKILFPETIDELKALLTDEQ